MLEYLCIHNVCTHGEMDITTVFGTVIGGSNPSESTRILKAKHYVFRFLNLCSRRDSNGGGLGPLRP